jgi:hypothetical protein
MLLIAVLLASAAAGGGGFKLGYSTADALGSAALAKVQDQTAQQQLADQRRATQLLQDAQARAIAAEAVIDTDDAALSAQAAQLKERTRYVTSTYIPAQGSAPVALPRCVFTRGFVRDYNAAIGVPSPEAVSAAGAGPAPVAASGADTELLDSGVQQSDIHDHIADYGQRCQHLADQVNGLLDYLQVPK